MPNSFPQIKQDLIDAIKESNLVVKALSEASLIKEKTYTNLINELQGNIKTHHDIIYGYLNSDGIWIPGVLQWMQDLTKKQKEVQEMHNQRQQNFAYVWTGIVVAFFSSVFGLFLTIFHKT